eukprot:752163-Hanusia_phi.AAC.6
MSSKKSGADSSSPSVFSAFPHAPPPPAQLPHPPPLSRYTACRACERARDILRFPPCWTRREQLETSRERETASRSFLLFIPSPANRLSSSAHLIIRRRLLYYTIAAALPLPA